MLIKEIEPINEQTTVEEVEKYLLILYNVLKIK